MGLFFKPLPASDAPRSPLTGRSEPKAKDRKPAKKRAFVDPSLVSPFFADHSAAGVADRMGEVNRQRSDWVLISICLSVCLLASLGLNAYQAVRTTLIPFKVVVDGQSGYILDSGTVEPMDTIEDVYIQRDLREFITGLRTVTTDRAATITRFNHSFTERLAGGSPAQTYLSDFFRREGENPNELLGKAQRTVVEFTGPVPIKGTNTWSFQWIERTAMNGTVAEDLYRGSMTVQVLPVTDFELAQKNPLGVWVDGIQWEKVSSKILDLKQLNGASPLELLYPDPNRPAGAPGFETPATAADPASRPVANLAL